MRPLPKFQNESKSGNSIAGTCERSTTQDAVIVASLALPFLLNDLANIYEEAVRLPNVSFSFRFRLVTGLNCITALKALGEETRLRMLRLLFKKPLSVTEITESLSASQYNISKHLRIMREAGLLEMKKEGQQRLYSVPEALKADVAANNNVLDLGCCTFRLDKLPK